MSEKRHNWSEYRANETRKKREQREALMVELERVRTELRKCGLDFDGYDELKRREGEAVAKLITL